MSQLSNSRLAYLGLRFAFGISLLVHGSIRFPKLQAFATGMAGQFDGTLLDGFPSLTFAYVIPFAETLIALSILIGWKVIRWGAFSGLLLMGGIMLGTCMLEKWELLPSQLIHMLIFYIILMNPHTPGIAIARKD
ncbi:MAG: hypothetical protein P1U86_22555 [Verrucomicrobiales bacterium]|nr:hypothetical protein [Verrucomicrobiales bacterium]